MLVQTGLSLCQTLKPNNNGNNSNSNNNNNNNNNNNGRMNNEQIMLNANLENLIELLDRICRMFHYLISNFKDYNFELNVKLRAMFLNLIENAMQSENVIIRKNTMKIWTFILDDLAAIRMIGHTPQNNNNNNNNSNNNNKGNTEGNESNIRTTQVITQLFRFMLMHFQTKFHHLSQFETEHEWQIQQSQLKVVICKLTSQCISLRPQECIKLLGEFTISVMKSSPNDKSFVLFCFLYEI